MATRRFSSLTTSENPGLMNAGSRGGIKIDRIVLHHNATTNKNVAMNTWLVSNGMNTSAHYEVTDTEIIGCVEETYAAYHCGGTGGSDVPTMANPNQRTIGIENVNSTGYPDWKVSKATTANTAKLVRDLCDFYGIPCDRKHVLKHSEVTATACPGGLDVDEVVRLANGGKPSTGGSTGGSTTPTQPAKNVNVTYELHDMTDNKWLGAIKNSAFTGNDSSDYAGYPTHQHDMLTVKVSHGSVQYRVHTHQSGWLDWVSGSNRNEPVNGYAGLKGQAIDAVQILYITPKNEMYQQAWYRSQTTAHAGWLGTVCDLGQSIPQYTDTYAGTFGESLDRLQLDIH